MDRMGTDITIKIDINVNNSITKVQVDRSSRVTEDSRSNLADVTARQNVDINKLSKYGMDSAIRGMDTKIGNNRMALDPVKTPTEKLSGILETVKTTAKGLNESIAAKVESLGTQVAVDQQAAYDAAKKTNEEALETQDEIEKNKDSNERGDDGGIEMDDMGGGKDVHGRD